MHHRWHFTAALMVLTCWAGQHHSKLATTMLAKPESIGLGMTVVIHKEAKKCSSWVPHGVDRWYLGPAQEHYRCWKVYCTKTKAKYIANTMDFSATGSHAICCTSWVSSTSGNWTGVCNKNLAPAVLFTRVRARQIDAMTKLAEIFQGTTSVQDEPEPLPQQAPRVEGEPDQQPFPRVAEDPERCHSPRDKIGEQQIEEIEQQQAARGQATNSTHPHCITGHGGG